MPRPAAGAQVPAGALLQLGREALDPAMQRDVVHGHAPVGEQALEVVLAERELEGPAHRPQDDLGRGGECGERRL